MISLFRQYFRVYQLLANLFCEVLSGVLWELRKNIVCFVTFLWLEWMLLTSFGPSYDGLMFPVVFSVSDVIMI